MTFADSHASQAAATAVHQPWRKLAALLLVVAACGLPINDIVTYALLIAATVLVVTGAVSAPTSRWLWALAVLAICWTGQILLAPPRIEEGHNVFVVDGAGGALEGGLPREAFRVMAAEFDTRYPAPRRCDPAKVGCWRGQKFPDRPFAFSADGIFDRPLYSRRVTGIDFADPVWLRLGFINELSYNWNGEVSDVDRAIRLRGRPDLLHRWRLAMPWFVMYRFPDEFVGSALCWCGEVLWEQDDAHFDAIAHPSMQCRTLAEKDVGRRIFGLAIGQPIAMRLQPSASIRLRQLIAPALALITGIVVLGLIVTPRWRRTALPFALIAIALIVVFLNDASFVGGVRPFDGGDDGLVYDGFARIMLRRLVAGDLAGALEGGEQVFYFTPGMRYLRVVEHVFFGESYLGYLALILTMPFLVFALFRRFLPLRWALAMVVIFVAVPVGALFGSSFFQYVKWAARGFADPAAYVCFLAGFVLLIGKRADDERCDEFAAAAGAGLLFALALFIRPNIAPLMGVLLAGAGLAALWQRQYRRLLGMIVGFLPVLGMALHNWVYGGLFVVFTSTAAHPGALVMPPAVYLAALVELVRFDFGGAQLVHALRQIGGWLAGPSESILMVPFNAAAIAIVLRVATWQEADPWLRLTAVATLAQHCVGLFYLTAGRYHYLTWLLTLLLVAAWVHGEGIAICQRRFPALSEPIARHPASRALGRGLARLSQLV